MVNKLTDKQKRFCQEYLIDLNATQAAIRSGYSEKTANVIGAENLSKPYLQAHIAELRAEIQERNNMTIDELVMTLANMSRFDLAECYDKDGKLKSIHDIPKEHRMAIGGIETLEQNFEGVKIGQVQKLKILDRNAAIDKLMRHLGGYETDNKQKTSKIRVVIEDE
jgi:phage terminase small subunit